MTIAQTTAYAAIVLWSFGMVACVLLAGGIL